MEAGAVRKEAAPGSPALRRAVLLLAVVLCGAAVMEVEILGARVVGPWFGVSLFVWTSLITVTLLSLALGYWLGGRAADAGGTLARLGVLVAAAGGAVLAVPLLRGPVLKVSSGAGIRVGALLAAAALFGPALTLLGTVTPFAAKLLLQDLREAGRTVGKLSALSTLGSFAGTVATGFWIIPAFHVDTIAAGSAFVLLALAGGCLAVSLRRPALLALPLPALLLLHAPPLAKVTLPSGTTAEVICRRGSFYGQISIVDYRFGAAHTREMLIDGVIQGGVDMTSGESVYPYPYALEQAALASVPGARTALVVGLGPASVPARLARYGLRGTVVEIDPEVVELSTAYFGFAPDSFAVVVGDGRRFLAATSERFDLVLLDAFSAENEPSHLFTQEAFRAVSRVLSPGGALVINLSGPLPGVPGDGRLLDSVHRTLGTVFPETEVYHEAPEQGAVALNYTLVGKSHGRPEVSGTPARPFLPVHPMASADLEGFLSRRYWPAAGAGQVYTDAWAPVEFHGAATKLLWRRALLATTPAEILLN